MNLTSKQWFQIVSGTVSGLITGAALFTTLLGPDWTPKIIAGLGILNIVISSIGAAVSGQGNLVRDVAAMPGVERVAVNANANQTLAQIATDPTQPKIGATTPQAREVILETAKGA